MEDYLSEDIKTLLQNPDMEMGFAYSDSGSCWKLIHELLNRLRKSQLERKLCTWTITIDKTYETSCGKVFPFHGGGVKFNSMIYCSYCRNLIDEVGVGE